MREALRTRGAPMCPSPAVSAAGVPCEARARLLQSPRLPRKQAALSCHYRRTSPRGGLPRRDRILRASRPAEPGDPCRPAIRTGPLVLPLGAEGRARHVMCIPLASHFCLLSPGMQGHDGLFPYHSALPGLKPRAQPDDIESIRWAVLGWQGFHWGSGPLAWGSRGVLSRWLPAARFLPAPRVWAARLTRPVRVLPQEE